MSDTEELLLNESNFWLNFDVATTNSDKLKTGTYQNLVTLKINNLAISISVEDGPPAGPG